MQNNNFIMYSSEFYNSIKKSKILFNLRKNGLVALIDNDQINIYKIKSNKKLDQLITDTKKMYDEFYNIILVNDQKFKKKILNSSYNPFFRDMMSYHLTTNEEIYDYYNLYDESNRDKFYEENFINIEDKIIIDDKMSINIEKKESIDETINRIAKERITCVFKRKSKLADTLSCIDNYFNLDFIAQIICQFIDSTSNDFSSEQLRTLDSNEERIKIMQFTSKEKELSHDDKISFIRDVLETLDIECIYSKSIDEMDNIIFDTYDSKLILEYAKHNNYILENSQFTNIYNEIINDKKLIKKISN